MTWTWMQERYVRVTPPAVINESINVPQWKNRYGVIIGRSKEQNPLMIGKFVYLTGDPGKCGSKEFGAIEDNIRQQKIIRNNR